MTVAGQAEDTAPVLGVRGLTVDLQTPAGTLHAVRGVDFEVRRGETLCIVGESGCGKTMAALAVMGLLPPNASVSAQRLSLEGTDLLRLGRRSLAAIRGDRMAMIFQDPMTSLNPVFTIGNQLEEAFIRHGKGGRREARERAEHLLERVGILSPRLRVAQYPHQLSGGQRQRMMIAMALMCGPALLIADEPTTALDVTVQAQILRLLANLQREFHLALILITHDLGIVARVAARVAVMYAGEVVEYAPTPRLFAAPTHPYTRALLDCVPDPERYRRGDRLGSIPGMVPALIGSLEGCAYRNRCPHASDACTRGPIHPQVAGEGHLYRCVLPAGAAPAAAAGLFERALG
jgi:peptide/nickel transport system ATP-binding protein